MEPLFVGGPTRIRRQILPSPSPTTTTIPHTCSPYLLPSGGILNLGNNNFLTLENQAVFQPRCTGVHTTRPLDPIAHPSEVSVLDDRAPFYASTNPQIYAISGATIVSYMLVIMLFITPRTFYVGGVGGGVSLFGRRGTMGGSYGSNTVIGIGSRPWLQKLAALTLAISMTIVTADTFKWAEKQYMAGYEDTDDLSAKVIKGLEIRIVRLISETFLWLAQAQTLIRLFQRHKEKLVIKWTAFVLITLEIIFAILNHFVHEGDPHQPRAFANSIPALNYLFALSLNICYAAFVIVYALRKRRLAFFHPQMHSMPLMALLSLVAILIPVIFFILDLSKPDVSGWGSYVRWVGACAASVVVWEWVERIEALDREEKKDGILGREVFDGDEMLENSNSSQSWPKPPGAGGRSRGFVGSFGSGLELQWSRLNQVAKRIGRTKAPEITSSKNFGINSQASRELREKPDEVQHQHQVTAQTQISSPPMTTSSPVSRNDSSSAASTVYAVRYHPVTEPTPPILEDPSAESADENHEASNTDRIENRPSINPSENKPTAGRFSRFPIPFRRQRQSPPAEVAAALAGQQMKMPSPGPIVPSTLLERMHLRKPQRPIQVQSGVIYVPAPPRRRPSSAESQKDDLETNDMEEFDDSESQGDDDRPPAVVRNALRMSNPASPVVERGPTFTPDIMDQRASK